VKITSVEVEVTDEVVAHGYRWRQGLPRLSPHQKTAQVTINTDDGVSGVALMSHGTIVQDVFARGLTDVLVGQNPLNKEDIWKRVLELDRLEEIPIYGLGVVDIALWDLTGKVAGLPVYQLLGGFRDRIPAYASTVTYETLEEFLDIADQCLAAGFRAIKLHAWGDARKDAHLCQALRNHVGPDIALMYDGSAGFDLLDAIYLGRALGEADYLWYEEPMREFSVDAYRRLREKIDVPLLAGETSDGVHFNIADFIRFDACDLVRTSTHYKGGFTGGLRVAHIADGCHMRAEVHGGGLPNLHLACAIPNTTYYESLVTTNPIVVEPGIDGEGFIAVTAMSGIGWDGGA
jgi:L-alanine-DL-glutamate epimerase-like enolase superfamily enzyme